MDGQEDFVSRLAALVEVGVLEVVRGLGEAVQVGDVVDHVCDVESIGASGIEVVRGGRLCFGVDDVIVNVPSFRFLGEGRLRAFVRNDVIATMDVRSVADDKREWKH